MKFFTLPCVGLFLLMTGCTTKVYNQPPVGQNTVIEKERPVVTEREPEPRQPEVQNNIHVDPR